MQLVFSDHPVPLAITKSLFLAGPSPRNNNAVDWRHEALQYLADFDGTVFLPIPKNQFYGNSDDQHAAASWTYDHQIEWECECRHVADIIVFWVARDVDGGMPGFTTNIEFGEDLHSGKIVYGRPKNAERCRYLDKRVEVLNLPIFTSLADTIQHTISLLGPGAFRKQGEVYVPLFIWKTEQFQSWYANLKLAGNRLEKANVLHVAELKPSKHVFSYILWVKIWIETEQRYKENEFVFARKDISTVVAHYRDSDDDIKIAIVKEFRSPVNNANGFVYELPGGSSSLLTEIDPLLNAKHELEEEVGLSICDLSRFKYVGRRQLAATLSSHRAELYSIELNKEEYEQIVENERNVSVFGVTEDSEKTYVKMMSISQLKDSFLDFSMLGMVYQAIYLK